MDGYVSWFRELEWLPFDLWKMVCEYVRNPLWEMEKAKILETLFTVYRLLTIEKRNIENEQAFGATATQIYEKYSSKRCNLVPYVALFLISLPDLSDF